MVAGGLSSSLNLFTYTSMKPCHHGPSVAVLAVCRLCLERDVDHEDVLGDHVLVLAVYARLQGCSSPCCCSGPRQLRTRHGSLQTMPSRSANSASSSALTYLHGIAARPAMVHEKQRVTRT